MKRYALLLGLLLATLLAPKPARAITHFLHPNSRPALARMSDGTARLFALARAAPDAWVLAWKSGDGDWIEVPSPTGVTTFYAVTGVQSATTAAGPQLYLVAAPHLDDSGTSGGTNAAIPATLWNFDVGSGSWHAVLLPVNVQGGIAPDLRKSPAFSVAVDPANQTVIVGVRNYQGEVWIGRIGTGRTIRWQRGAAACGAASRSSPVAINAALLPIATHLATRMGA